MTIMLLFCLFVGIYRESLNYPFWMISISLTWIHKLNTAFNPLLTTLITTRNQTISYYRIVEYAKKKQEIDIQATLQRKESFDFKAKVIQIKDFEYFDVKGDKEFKLIIDSLEIIRGEKVAIIGRKGSGKHRLVDVLMRLKKRGRGGKTENEIFKVFGQDVVRTKTEFIKKNICYLSEKPKIFHATIFDAINPDGLYSMDEVVKASHYLKFMDLQAV